MPKAPLVLMFFVPLAAMGAAFIVLRKVAVPMLWAVAHALLVWTCLVLLLWAGGRP